jgi:large subunit ribosomal protein L21
MKFVVIETGGKQYLVSDNKSITVEKLPEAAGGKVVFDKVILSDDGTKTTLGTPYIAGAKVEAEVSSHGAGKKTLVVKYKQKSRYLKRRGHRQPFSKATIRKV